MFSSIPLRLEAEGDAEALDHVSRAGGMYSETHPSVRLEKGGLVRREMVFKSNAVHVGLRFWREHL